SHLSKMRGLWILAALPAAAKVLQYDWDITWVDRAPHGVHRPVIGVNGEWPNPTIRGNVGDTVVVNVFNALGNQTTSLHWHGMYMTDTPHMDGASAVSQCPILPGQNFTYEFKLELGGTYWWHSHDGGQYADGLRGPLIVDDPQDPNLDLYDEEYMLSLSVPALLAQMLTPNNTQFRPPIAPAAVINEAATSTFTMVPGRRYRFRIINYSALANAVIQFGGHSMSVIETDGIPVVPTDTDRIFLGAGMRYSVVVAAKESTEKDFGVLVMLDMNPDYNTPVVGFPANATGVLKYSDANAAPDAVVVNTPITFLDDMTLSPSDLEPSHPYTVSVTKNFTFELDSLGIPRAFINGGMYVGQKVPTLYTALTVGDAATDAAVYGAVNPVVTEKNDVVQIVLNNFTPASHPFHLHGHHFQVLARGPIGAGPFTGILGNVSAAPLYRDTIQVEGNSYVVLRYLAARPGAWIFHCHMEWHVHMGATSTFITAPLDVQKSLVVPQSQMEICPCGDARGNAAGNMMDAYDLQGANMLPPLPDNGAMYNASAEAVCASNATTSSYVVSMTSSATLSQTTTLTNWTSASTSVSVTTSLPASVTTSSPASVITSATALPIYSTGWSTITEEATTEKAVSTKTKTKSRCRARSTSVTTKW
ncbi:hypothetical protein TD95_003583, partial [Thielaviopsis punctulata]